MTTRDRDRADGGGVLENADGRPILGYPPVADLTLLFEASRHLLGYFLHTSFTQYISLLSQNMTRWVQHGLIGKRSAQGAEGDWSPVGPALPGRVPVIGSDGRPSKETDYAILLDVDSLDFWKPAYLIGNYAYIYFGHKKANYSLMQEHPGKRVLYLRGYEYEGALHVAGHVAMGGSSWDTGLFNRELGRQLGADVELFKILSPKDLWWETIGAQKYFVGAYEELRQCSSEPTRSIYLHAARWQEDIEELVDQMDHIVVYVSSITEGVLWELDMLQRKQRTEHTTVVFDAEAIGKKWDQVRLQMAMAKRFPGQVTWAKKRTKVGEVDVDELRAWLSQTFQVVTPEEFSAGIELHKTRIQDSNSPLGVGSREKPVEFVFHPAVDATKLQRIRALDAEFDATIRDMIASKRITNILWFLHLLNLKVITSVMLGHHFDTGRVMAIYAATMYFALKHAPAVYEMGEPSKKEQGARVEKILDEHLGMGQYLSTTLMGFGESHEFHSVFEAATKTYRESFDAAAEAVEGFFEEALRRLRP